MLVFAGILLSATFCFVVSASVVMTKKELREFDGTKPGKGPYLAVLGEVFDVSSKRDTYGPGGSYGFFSGRDGSRGFTTGKFDDEGLVDEVEDLDEGQLVDIHGWLEFYHKEKGYPYVGRVEGAFFDGNGEETEARKRILARVKEEKLRSENKAAEEEALNQKFPPCNSEWGTRLGHRVWCSRMSGGVARNWVGVPRKLFVPGKKSSERCICASDSMLTHPHLREYEGCDPGANSCQLEEPKEEEEEEEEPRRPDDEL